MPHPLTERCQKTANDERCTNQAVTGKTLCHHHSAKTHDVRRGNLYPNGVVTRRQLVIKFFLKDGEDGDDVRRRLEDIFRWRDGLAITVEEKKL